MTTGRINQVATIPYPAYHTSVTTGHCQKANKPGRFTGTGITATLNCTHLGRDASPSTDQINWERIHLAQAILLIFLKD